MDAQIQAAAQALEQIRAREYQSQYTKQLADTQARIEGLRREVSRQRHILSGLKPGVQCPMCKQTVTEETLPQVRKEFTVSVNELCRQGQEQTGQLKELQELDAKARAVFEQFRQEDAAKANAALSALKEKRGRMVEDSQDKSAERQKEIDRLHAEIQNTELDLEYGLLSPKEGERLRRIKEELTCLLSRPRRSLPQNWTPRRWKLTKRKSRRSSPQWPPILPNGWSCASPGFR